MVLLILKILFKNIKYFKNEINFILHDMVGEGS